MNIHVEKINNINSIDINSKIFIIFLVELNDDIINLLIKNNTELIIINTENYNNFDTIAKIQNLINHNVDFTFDDNLELIS